MYTIIGDPHIKNTNLHIVEQLFTIVENLKNPVIWLGDMLDNKEVIRGKSLNALYGYFKRSKLEHIVLVGNHDWFNLDCQDNSLQVLTELPNVTVVDHPQEIDGMTFIPYLPAMRFKALAKKVTGTVFIHQGLNGYDLGNGKIQTGGLEKSCLKKAKRIIAGHFHKHQEIYLGTPFSHSFGESDQGKVIGLYDPETDKMCLIDSRLPGHRTIEFDCQNMPDYNALIAMVGNYKEANHQVRIILVGSQESIIKFPKNQFKGIKIIERPNDSDLGDVLIEETADNVSQFRSWASDIKKLDPDTTNLGIQILESLT